MGGHRSMLEEQHRFLEAGHEMDAESDLFLLPLVLRQMETRQKSNHPDDASGRVSHRPKNK